MFLRCRKNGKAEKIGGHRGQTPRPLCVGMVGDEGSDPYAPRFSPPYFAEQGVGFQPVASACFLKLVLVTKGSVRYAGSSTTVVTTNHVSPLRSFERS